MVTRTYCVPLRITNDNAGKSFSMGMCLPEMINNVLLYVATMADIRVFALQIVGNTNDASTSLSENPSIKEYAATPGLAERAPMSTAKEVLEALARSKKGPLDFLQAIWKTLTLDLCPVDQIQRGPCTILDMAKEEFGATAVVDLYVLVQWLIDYLANKNTPWGLTLMELLSSCLGRHSACRVRCSSGELCNS